MLSNDQKKLATTFLAVTIAIALAWFLLVYNQPPKPGNPLLSHRPRQTDPPKKPLARPAQSAEQPSRPTTPDPIYIAIAPLPKPTPTTRPTTQPFSLDDALLAELEALLEQEATPPAPPQPAVPVEVARHALAFVGADAEAEQVWYVAINDPMLAPNVRKDLIEDLNEDGFPDPRNITADDLPLIYSRIALIEQIAPDAMDETNAAAFTEAYNDLVNMVIRLSQQ